MAINIVPGSVKLTVATRPAVGAPFVGGPGPFMNFRCTAISVQGECKITGSPGDNPAGWTLGLIQLKFVDTDWAYYRGKSNGDGSCFLQYSRPPALPKAACRDTLAVGGIFVDNRPGVDRTVAAAGAPFPIALSAAFSDAPSRSFYLKRPNGLTTKDNFLREAQTELHFCTVLSLKSPAGAYHHLKSVYWNVHWQGRFEPTNFANLSAPWTIHASGGIGNSAHVSSIVDGGPTEARFSGVITAPATPNCNAMTNTSYSSPNVKESGVWTNFDVTR